MSLCFSWNSNHKRAAARRTSSPVTGHRRPSGSSCIARIDCSHAGTWRQCCSSRRTGPHWSLYSSPADAQYAGEASHPHPNYSTPSGSVQIHDGLSRDFTVKSSFSTLSSSVCFHAGPSRTHIQFSFLKLTKSYIFCSCSLHQRNIFIIIKLSYITFCTLISV